MIHNNLACLRVNNAEESSMNAKTERRKEYEALFA